MAYISNKEKKRLENQENNSDNKNPDYKFLPKDPSKTKFWKITNIVLISLMVLLPLICVIILIVQSISN